MLVLAGQVRVRFDDGTTLAVEGKEILWGYGRSHKAQGLEAESVFFMLEIDTAAMIGDGLEGGAVAVRIHEGA